MLAPSPRENRNHCEFSSITGDRSLGGSQAGRSPTKLGGLRYMRDEHKGGIRLILPIGLGQEWCQYADSGKILGLAEAI